MEDYPPPISTDYDFLRGSPSSRGDSVLETSDLISFEKNVFKAERGTQSSRKIIDHINSFTLGGDRIIAISHGSTIHFLDFNSGKEIGNVNMVEDNQNSNTVGSRVYFFSLVPEIPMYVAIYEQGLYEINLTNFTKELLNNENQIYSYYYQTATLLGNNCIVYITHRDELIVYNLKKRRKVMGLDPGFGLYSLSKVINNTFFCGGAENVVRCRVELGQEEVNVFFEKEDVFKLEGNAYTVTTNHSYQRLIIGTSKGVVIIVSTNEEENKMMTEVTRKKVVPSIIPGLICVGSHLYIISFFLKYVRVFNIETEISTNSEERRHKNDINTIIWLDENRKQRFLTAGDDGRVCMWKSNVFNADFQMDEQDVKERFDFLMDSVSMESFSKVIRLDNIQIKVILASCFFL